MDLNILLSEKKWHQGLFDRLKDRYQGRINWVLINERSGFTYEAIARMNPQNIFIPHWSYLIEKNIYENYNCIVFHMTDLPFGRGGSPLQNLIVRGINETRISAIKVNEGIDTGDIYLKEALSLDGTAREIFERATPIIQGMIENIIDQKLLPKPQQGEVVTFKRRKIEDGNIAAVKEIQQMYDYIRMLDCEGYPNAFLETENFRIEFSNAKFDHEQKIINANVRIYKK